MNALRKLSNDEVELNLKKYVLQERQLLHVVLEHIKEVEIRKIYLQRAYSSMYEYLIKEHNYSGSAAMRRLEAARLLRIVPEMAEKIKDGSVNLSKIGEMTKAIKEKEKTTSDKVSSEVKIQLISLICNKTTAEAQHSLAAALDIKIKDHEVQRAQKDESVRVELTLSKELKEKIDKCKDLAAHLLLQKYSDTSLASVIEVLVDQFLEQNIQAHPTPVRRSNSTQSTIEGSTAGESLNAETPTAISTTAAVVTEINKTLTPKTRNAVLQRDECCQDIDKKSGKRCGSKFARQVDHKTPRWASGNHQPENLQVLCAAHNSYKYQQESSLRMVQ